jgi:hypothetical protein
MYTNNAAVLSKEEEEVAYAEDEEAYNEYIKNTFASKHV